MSEEIDFNALKKIGFLKSREEGLFTFRSRMPNGNYGPKQLEALAKVANDYGRGLSHATTRQGIEIPFIKYADIEAVQKIVKESGLLTGTSGPRLRTTTTCPGTNWCGRGLVDPFEMAEKIEKAGFVCALDLPHKFKISVSGCLNSCVRVESSEFGIHGAVNLEDKSRGYIIYVAGCGGRQPRHGIKLEKVYTEDEVLKILKNTIDFFAENAKPRQRLALLVDEYGKEKFLKKILDL